MRLFRRLSKRSVILVYLACVMSLGCWSSNTLLIPRTPTPFPTAVPPTPDTASLYAVGDRVEIVGEGFASVYLTREAEPETRRNRVPNAACYPNTTVEILSAQIVDGITYYEVTCNNNPGWLDESKVAKR
jgi:hypothetical protein